MYGDHELADDVSTIEQAMNRAGGPDEMEVARRQLLAALTQRLFA